MCIPAITWIIILYDWYFLCLSLSNCRNASWNFESVGKYTCILVHVLLRVLRASLLLDKEKSLPLGKVCFASPKRIIEKKDVSSLLGTLKERCANIIFFYSSDRPRWNGGSACSLVICKLCKLSWEKQIQISYKHTCLNLIHCTCH